MRFEDLRGLRNWVLGLLYVYLAITLLTAGSSVMQVGVLHRLASGDFGSHDEMMAVANANDSREQFLGWAQVAAFLVSGIVSLVWTYRAVRNAAGLSAMPPKFTPGWSVGWYFVPIATLWKPFQAMNELWRRSAHPATMAAPSALGWWWFLWIGSNILSQASLRVTLNANDVDGYVLATWVSFWSDVATMPLILIYAWIINRITLMQIDKLAAYPDGPPDRRLVQMSEDLGPDVSGLAR